MKDIRQLPLKAKLTIAYTLFGKDMRLKHQQFKNIIFKNILLKAEERRRIFILDTSQDHGINFLRLMFVQYCI